MTRHRILTSLDGPGDNVLVVKPPLCFSLSDAAEFLAALEEGLVAAREGRSNGRPPRGFRLRGRVSPTTERVFCSGPPCLFLQKPSACVFFIILNKFKDTRVLVCRYARSWVLRLAKIHHDCAHRPNGTHS